MMRTNDGSSTTSHLFDIASEPTFERDTTVKRSRRRGGVGDDTRAMEGQTRMARRAKTATLAVDTGTPTAGAQQVGRKRVQIDFSPTAYARLETIRERSDANSNAETVRSALRLYDWFLPHTVEGYDVRLVKGDEERPVELLW